MTRATATNNKWRRRSRQEWETVFARFAASGLGIEPFCAREGLSESTFRRWRSLLGEPSTQPAAPVMEPTGFVDAGTLKVSGNRAAFLPTSSAGGDRIEADWPRSVASTALG